MNNKLQVVTTEEKPIPRRSTTRIKTYREEIQARFERKWHQNPEQFSGIRSAKERERIERTIALITDTLNLKGKRVVDLGCGNGEIAKRLRDKGALVDAVDIAKNSLNKIREESNIKPVHSCVPNTHLDDNSYDLVVCTELIGHLSQREHRLFFNELARLVKKGGYIVCSTNIDINSEDALDLFIKLAETELKVKKFRLSYHSRFIRLLNLLKTPSTFALASADPYVRTQGLNNRYSISKRWFQFNSSKHLGIAWKGISLFTTPLVKSLKQSSWLLSFLEKVSVNEKCISHVILLAQRKPLEGFITGN